MPDQSKPESFAARPLLVLALGGNALSPPARAEPDDYAVERQIAGRTALLLNRLASPGAGLTAPGASLTSSGYRLLIVHGNGPQVGRLLRQDPLHGNLDIHIAQTQGELGYLLAAAMKEPAVCLLTRVRVGEDPGPPVKPIGPVLSEQPEGGSYARTGSGWRLTVPSPRPEQVIEQPAISELLARAHVIAGGGGGVPLKRSGAPVDGVVDKDWVASMLAVALSAQALVFATNVTGVYPRPELFEGDPIATLSPASARGLIESGAATAGAMAPKLESAVEFVLATGRSAHICELDQIELALAGRAGTAVR